MAVATEMSPAKKWLKKNKQSFQTVDGYPGTAQRATLYQQITGGKYVGILTPQGLLLTGRAVMQNSGGWVLGCSGPDNAQAVATKTNVVYVSGGRL